MTKTLRTKKTLANLFGLVLVLTRGLPKRVTGRRIPRGAAGLVLGLLLGGHATTALAQVTAGSIGADQAVCAGSAPAPLTGTAAGGGTGNYVYQWESSPDNFVWAAIAGATGDTYAPGPLAATTYFRRRVTSGTGSSATATSNAVAVTVLPALTAGAIGADQTLSAGATPAPLTSIAGAAGGTGTYAYQWEASPDNVFWAAIPGATAPNYAPGPLAATTYFRRRVISGFCAPATSSAVTLTVRPILASRAAATSALPVYPNPSSSGELTLRLDGPGRATLLNALGQVVLTKDLVGTADQTLITSGLAPGVYTLRVATAGRTLTRSVALE